MNKLRDLMQKIDSADVGLALVGGGVALIHFGAALIIVGAILVLQVRPLRTWL
jgi:hypothetical protein